MLLVVYRKIDIIQLYNITQQRIHIYTFIIHLRAENLGDGHDDDDDDDDCIKLCLRSSDDVDGDDNNSEVYLRPSIRMVWLKYFS